MKARAFMVLVSGLLFCGGVLAQPPVAPAGTDPRQAVEAVASDFQRAMGEGYAEGVVRHLAPEVVIFEGGEVVAASGGAYIRGSLQADLRYAATVRRQLVHRKTTVSGEMAVVMSQTRNQGTFEGRAINLMRTETLVLRWIEGAWKIIHIHWSGYEPPP